MKEKELQTIKEDFLNVSKHILKSLKDDEFESYCLIDIQTAIDSLEDVKKDVRLLKR